MDFKSAAMRGSLGGIATLRIGSKRPTIPCFIYHSHRKNGKQRSFAVHGEGLLTDGLSLMS
jgi:hypothetical protein